MGIFSSARKAGFTLIELLVIVMILAILTSLALPQYRRSVERARVAEALTMLRASGRAWPRRSRCCALFMTPANAGLGRTVMMIAERLYNLEKLLLTSWILRLKALFPEEEKY